MIWPFLLTPLGKIAGTVLAVAAAWFMFARHYESKGAEKTIAQFERASDANAAKADAARKKVAATPADKLNDRYRRD